MINHCTCSTRFHLVLSAPYPDSLGGEDPMGQGATFFRLHYVVYCLSLGSSRCVSCEVAVGSTRRRPSSCAPGPTSLPTRVRNPLPCRSTSRTGHKGEGRPRARKEIKPRSSPALQNQLRCPRPITHFKDSALHSIQREDLLIETSIKHNTVQRY